MNRSKQLAVAFLAGLLCLSPVAHAETAQPTVEAEVAEGAQSSELTALGYVRVTAGSESRWFPLPEEEPYSFTIRQTGADGSEMNNTITITPDGVLMKDSDCDGQDCVGEGTVTLSNKSERILGNMIICLPHQISIELYSVEELTVDTAQENAQ